MRGRQVNRIDPMPLAGRQVFCQGLGVGFLEVLHRQLHALGKRFHFPGISDVYLRMP